MLINLKTHIQTQSKQLLDVLSKTIITTSRIERFCFFLYVFFHRKFVPFKKLNLICFFICVYFRTLSKEKRGNYYHITPRWLW